MVNNLLHTALKAGDGLMMRRCAVVARSALFSLSSSLVHHSPLGLPALLMQSTAPVLELLPASLLPVRSYQGSAQPQQTSHVIFASRNGVGIEIVCCLSRRNSALSHPINALVLNHIDRLVLTGRTHCRSCASDISKINVHE